MTGISCHTNVIQCILLGVPAYLILAQQTKKYRLANSFEGAKNIITSHHPSQQVRCNICFVNVDISLSESDGGLTSDQAEKAQNKITGF